MEIRYERLNRSNFDEHSLDSFIRRQTVHETWQHTDEGLKLLPKEYVESWSVEECREIARDIMLHMEDDQSAFGAFAGEELVGFATVSHNIFGKSAKYAELVCFQVSEPYRHHGIGRQLFSLAREEAKKIGAKKLYISACSAKETQAAYKALGCTLAEEINEQLAEEEPCDIRLELAL